MELQDAKALVLAHYDARAAARPGGYAGALAQHAAPGLLWRGLHPFGELTGPEAVAEAFWEPLSAALGPLQRRTDIFFAGRSRLGGGASTWVVAMGHLAGTFTAPWLGLRPSRRMAFLRTAEFHRCEAGRIVEQAMFFDLLGFIDAAGLWPLPRPTGAHVLTPGPQTGDGVLTGPCPPAEGTATLAAIETMMASMENRERYASPAEELRVAWADDMIWWGPAGIGATYTIERYMAQHQQPFRRHLAGRRFNGHVARLAEGTYGGFFGWPNLTLRNAGGYMGMPAAEHAADMRVVDIYRREGDRLAENWIFIDLPHFLAQQGLDVLARARAVFP